MSERHIVDQHFSKPHNLSLDRLYVGKRFQIAYLAIQGPQVLSFVLQFINQLNGTQSSFWSHWCCCSHDGSPPYNDFYFYIVVLQAAQGFIADTNLMLRLQFIL